MTTILLVDPHPAVRAGIRAILSKHRAFKVVAEAENGRDAVRLAKRHKPAVIITDIVMPLLNGLEAARRILEALPQSRVIVLSGQQDEQFIAWAMAVKVAGYLIKTSSTLTLAQAVRDVAAGKQAFSPAIERYIKAHSKMPEAKPIPAGLTPRELDVVHLVTEELQNKQIAGVLEIGEGRVKRLIEQIMEKLNVETRLGIATFAMNAGITKGRMV